MPETTRGGGCVGLVPSLAFLQSDCVPRLSLSWLHCGFFQENPRGGKKRQVSKVPLPLSKTHPFPPPPGTPWAWAGSLAHDPGPPGRFTKIKPVNDWPPERSHPYHPACLPRPRLCRAGRREWGRPPLSSQEQPGLKSSRKSVKQTISQEVSMSGEYQTRFPGA